MDPEVLDFMLPYLANADSFGNPSSVHQFGRRARAAIDEARDLVGALMGAEYSEIYFTGSGTEADNLALSGTMMSASPDRRHLVTTAVEHPAVLQTARHLSNNGCRVTVLGVDRDGFLSPESLETSVTDSTTLVSVMHANNEVGTVMPIQRLSEIAHRHGALMHTDAIQTVGLLPVDFKELGCDLMSVSAHKIYGPKGIGALAIKQGIKVSPMILGGTQEREKRAGTENVAAIAGFGKAAQITLARRREDAETQSAVRDYFIGLLRGGIPGLRLNGPENLRLPNNVNVSVEEMSGSTLLMNLDRYGVAASSGSACSSGSIEPSHVLKALGLSDSLASGGVRFSLGRSTTRSQLETTVEIFVAVVNRLRR